MSQSFVHMAREFYLDEINDHLTYTALAKKTKDANLRANIVRIAQMEHAHADFWHAFLIANEAPLPAQRVNKGRLACLHLLQAMINPVMLVSLLELSEMSSVRRYHAFLNQAPLDDAAQARLRGIVLDELEHEVFFKKTAQALGATHLRDFVLGMNDGLVELLGTVAGLSAVYPHSPRTVAVSGLIVGLAGALSMGIGAFISVRSQRQVREGTRERLEMLFTIAPDRAVQAYSAELVAAGIPANLAEDMARQLSTNHAALTQLILQDSDDNEVRSGLFTGGAYLVGVLFPVLPYFFAASSLIALPFSVLGAGLALLLVALVVALLSGISIKKKIWEMVLAGFTAAGVAYAFGKLMQSVFGIEGLI